MRSVWAKAAVFTSGILLACAAAVHINAIAWLNYLASPGSPLYSASVAMRENIWVPVLAFVLGLLLAAGSLPAKGVPDALSRISRVVLGVLTSIGVIFLLYSSVKSDVFFNSYWQVGLAVGLAACAALSGWVIHGPCISGKKRALRWGAATLALWPMFLYATYALTGDGISGLGGLGTVFLLREPLAFQKPLPILPEIIGGSMAGAIAGAAISAVIKSKARVGAAMGFAAGLAVSAISYLLQSGLLATALKSVYSDNAVLKAAILSGIAASLAVSASAGLAFFAINAPAKREARSGALALAAAIVLGYCGVKAVAMVESFSGYNLISAALAVPLDNCAVYLHIQPDSTISRSIENRAGPAVLRFCEELIVQYPESCYRPAAFYLKAAAEFERWQFKSAAETLEQMRYEYPNVAGAPGILLFLSYMASGDYKRAAGAGTNDWAVAQWQDSEGSQIVATMWERLGRFDRASGAYSLYADFVRQAEGPSSAAEALALSAEMASRKPGTLSNAEVRGRALLEGKPAAGVIVALVQPRKDAGSKAESREFVGARSLPLWRGLHGVTGADGRFSIRGVPSGEYEVVLGFDQASVPAGYVLAGARGKVSLRSGANDLGDFRFVKRMDISIEKSGSRYVLKWDAYPNAARYAVTIIPEGRDLTGQKPRTYQVSPKKGEITFNFPENYSVKNNSVLALAFDAAGNVVSSSEDYYSPSLGRLKYLQSASSSRSPNVRSSGGDQPGNI